MLWRLNGDSRADGVENLQNLADGEAVAAQLHAERGQGRSAAEAGGTRTFVSAQGMQRDCVSLIVPA